MARSAVDQDNNHTPTWLQIRNAGPMTTVRLHLTWAQFAWMQYRRVGYLERDGQYTVVRGEITPTATTYEFEVPSGVSQFRFCPRCYTSA